MYYQNPPYQQSCRINQNLLRPMKFIGSPMVKKKSWFNRLKRFFIRETNSKQETVKKFAYLFSFGLWFCSSQLEQLSGKEKEMDFWRAEDQKVILAHCTIIIKWKKSRWGWGRADQACSCCSPCCRCCCWSSCYDCSSWCWDCPVHQHPLI